MRIGYHFLCAAALLAWPVAAQAEVTQASEAGFVVGGERVVSGVTPSQAWAVLVRPSDWWASSHSWSGDAANMTLDARAGGCFCESIPGDQPGSVEHMRVVHVRPAALLRMNGTLGPLQSEALTGVLTIELTASDAGAGAGTATTIRWTYVVGGHARFPLTQIAPAVDQVLAEQMGRLDTRLQSRD